AGTIALAFWTHFFCGLLALGGISLAALARALRKEPPPPTSFFLSIAMGLAASAPWIYRYASQAALPIAESFRYGPGQISYHGLRVFNPFQLLREVSPPILVLALFALRAASRARLAPVVRTTCALATIGVLLVLFTPLYPVWSERLTGWTAVRLVSLAFFWIPAAAALIELVAPPAGRLRRGIGAALALAIFWLGAARVVRDYHHEDLYFNFERGAQAEARSLRDVLYGKKYVSIPEIAYGLAPHTLGHPLAVPNGRASPYTAFARRERDVALTLHQNSPACWERLFGLYPDVRYLVTPAEGARIERALWNRVLPRVSPEAVREVIRNHGKLKNIRAGPHFVVDEIQFAGSKREADRCPAEDRP
ncbi:MAG: hypothetical protein ACRD1Z_07675, partial [Vicinamibacteria bacterium]